MINQFVRILRRSKYVLFLQLVDKLFFFLIFLLFARTLNVEDYGNIVIVFSVSNIMLFMFQFGLPIYLQRQAATNNRNIHLDFTSSIIYGLISYLVGILVVLLVFYHIYGNQQYLLIVFIYTFIYSYYFISIFDSILIGKGVQRIQFVSYLYSRIITLLLIAAILIISPNPNIYILICLLGSVTIALLLYRYILKYKLITKTKEKTSFRSLKDLLRASLPVGITSLSYFLYDKIDIIIISKIINLENVAFYSISYGVYKSSLLFFSFILATGYTRVCSISRKKQGVVIFLKKYLIYVSIISFSFSLLIYFLSDFLVLLVYGEKYHSSVILLKVLSFSIIPLALNNLTGITMNGLGLYSDNMKIIISALLINIILNLFLLTNIGIIGSAYATVITEVYILFMGIYYINKKLIAWT